MFYIISCLLGDSNDKEGTQYGTVNSDGIKED